jgi:probable F420-dependent oxidoreductase
MARAMAVRIGLGLANFPFATVGAFWRWVERLETGGVDSLWQSDRLVSSTPQLEPMSLMAALAGATERLKFGMNVAVVSFRDPLVLAKECATVDFLSGGRLLPAFGVGPKIAPEWRATGRPYAGAGERADEALAVMARLWTGERVTLAGKHYRYDGARIAPLPVQQPLPLWIGGASPRSIRRTAEYGTGWVGGIQTPAQVAPVVAAIRAASAAAGRPIPEDHYGATFPYRFGSWDEPLVQQSAAALARLAPECDARAYAAVGGAADVLARIDEYVAAGATKFVLRPLALGDDDLADQTERLIAEVLPAVHGRRAA